MLQISSKPSVLWLTGFTTLLLSVVPIMVLWSVLIKDGNLIEQLRLSGILLPTFLIFSVLPLSILNYRYQFRKKYNLTLTAKNLYELKQKETSWVDGD